MAEATIFQDEFICPVCLDLLKDPVTIPCGHSYCSICISGCWDQEDQKRVYSCPQCRKTFTPRPALGKNIILAEMAEKLKKTKHPAHYAVLGDVQCDVCTGRKYKAVKSCLICLNSYCQTHLIQHENLFKGKRHSLMEATGRLKTMICQKHDKLMDVFCRTDGKCICVQCTIDEHKNHNTVSAAAQRTEEQRHLKEMQKKFKQRIQQRKIELKKLRDAVKADKCSAQEAVNYCEKIFTELIRYIERSRSEVTQLIRDQEKAAMSQAEELMWQLQVEIDNLEASDTMLEKLLNTQDHIHFLQDLKYVSAPLQTQPIPNIPFYCLLSDIRESVRQLRGKLENFSKKEIKKISDKVTVSNIVPRKNFLQYSHQLTVDLNTVNEFLCLSERNRAITYSDTVQPYPYHPDRFDEFNYQVLCKENLCGRCYWEVEWSGSYGVYISVSYKGITRKGGTKMCLFGHNDQSWSLHCIGSRYSFIHNNKQTFLPVECISSRIGVYVDYTAGTLSFYSISDAMRLIHTVQTTFTQPLYPGFYVCYGSSLKL